MNENIKLTNVTSIDSKQQFNSIPLFTRSFHINLLWLRGQIILRGWMLLEFWLGEKIFRPGSINQTRFIRIIHEEHVQLSMQVQQLILDACLCISDISALKVGVNDAHDGFMQFHWQQYIKFEVSKSPFSLCRVVSSSLVVTLTYTQKKLNREIYVMKSCY